MKPIIGMTMSRENEKEQILGKGYSDAIIEAGGVPLLIPYTTEDEVIIEMSRALDGLLLSGGGDIDPTLFDEEPLPGLGRIDPDRDEMEIALIEHFISQDKPILGICRGCQILNIALGGGMYQDLPSQKQNLLQHTQRAPRHHASHTITIEENTILHQIYRKTVTKVNSFHHQAVREVLPPLRVSAMARDGVIEAFESESHRFVVAVQWHPEEMVKTDSDTPRLFAAFVEACKEQQG
ncbi:gamma-glutamyl-gamma-aminobutyrate hydrolase family protein [Laceyella putida]|uniref:Gamma-glutamyl-gamma-aminobutyrate hydrolase family protein n=1 Tax=Laceyella putida TaxID=110101 RepID=A0ABW2RMP2_9BACL